MVFVVCILAYALSRFSGRSLGLRSGQLFVSPEKRLRSGRRRKVRVTSRY
jgi:hypothetical protein